jgi:predicted nucleic acid-binding protein
MIVLDTTVLVYAVGDPHPLREPCRRLVSAIADVVLQATTSVEVIQEFAHIRARRRGREDAHGVAAGFIDLLSPLLRPDETDLRHALELFVAHPQIGAFDAVLAATAIGTGHVQALISADRAFASIPGLTHINPADTQAIDSLLSKQAGG